MVEAVKDVGVRDLEVKNSDVLKMYNALTALRSESKNVFLKFDIGKNIQQLEPIRERLIKSLPDIDPGIKDYNKKLEEKFYSLADENGRIPVTKIDQWKKIEHELKSEYAETIASAEQSESDKRDLLEQQCKELKEMVLTKIKLSKLPQEFDGDLTPLLPLILDDRGE